MCSQRSLFSVGSCIACAAPNLDFASTKTAVQLSQSFQREARFDFCQGGGFERLGRKVTKYDMLTIIQKHFILTRSQKSECFVPSMFEV